MCPILIEFNHPGYTTRDAGKQFSGKTQTEKKEKQTK